MSSPHDGASPHAQTEPPARFRVKLEVEVDAADERDLLYALTDLCNGLPYKVTSSKLQARSYTPRTRRVRF